MATKEELIAELKDYGVDADLRFKKENLEKKLKAAKAVAKEVASTVEETEKITYEPKEEKMTKEVTGDYLRQYQVRKGTVPGSIKSNPKPGSKAKTMKGVLLKQEKVRIFVPREPKEDPSIKQSITLNGYRLDFPKQTYIEVPEQIAEVIMESQRQTDEAIATGQIDYEAKKEGVSYADALL